MPIIRVKILKRTDEREMQKSFANIARTTASASKFTYWERF